VSAVLPNAASSATLKADGPFVMEYRETSFHGPVTLYRLDYSSEAEWLLTVVEGGEDVGYFMESRADGSVIAGYPQWDEPHVLSGPSKNATLPAVYFAPRNLPTEPGQDGITVAPIEDAVLSPGQRESISLAADRSKLRPSDLIVLKTRDEVAVYSEDLGIPIWFGLPDADTAFFEVVLLEH
jgi:hypothetical protein